MIRLKQPFFTRKNFLVVLIAVVLAYIAVWGVVLGKNKIDHDKRVQIAKTEQTKIDSLSQEEKAIQKAEKYLTSSLYAVQPPQRLILDYLQRKYHLDEKLSVTTSSYKLPEDQAAYPSEINYVARIAYPDKLVTVPPKNKVSGMELTNIYSANCDHLTLPPNFWPTMEQNYRAGGYYLTHVALAFAFMKDNKCTVPQDKNSLQQNVITGMEQLADSPETSADLRYEAIAFLMLLDQHESVKASWIEKVISEQQSNGAWSKGVGDKKLDDHATVLALWDLLEYSRPNTPYMSLINPSRQ